MKRTGVRRLLVVPAALIGSLVFSGSALGVVTSSNITSPGDPSYIQIDGNTPGKTITVTGTVVSNDGTGHVDIGCLGGPHGGTPFQADVTPSYSGDNGTFSVPVTLDGGELGAVAGQTCRLIAVPAGFSGTDFSPFNGPRLAISNYYTRTYTGGPYAGRAYDFFISSSQLTGEADYRSSTTGGVYDAFPITSAVTTGGDVFYAGDTYDALHGAGHSYLEVDGANAFGPAYAEGICGSTTLCSMSGLPTISFSHSYGPTGDLRFAESEPLVKCAPNDTVFPPTSTSCTSFVPTGVTLHRSVSQVNGAQSTVIDTYTSTNGAAHRLSLESIADAKNPNGGFDAPGYDFPWVDGSTFKTHSAGDSEPGPPAARGTVFLNYDNSQYDGDTAGGQGAITFGSRPTGFVYANSGNSGSTHLVAKLTGTVPAGGSTTLSQVFSWGFTQAVVQRLAAQAQAALHGPVVAITSPGSGAHETKSPVKVSGTASAAADNGGLSSVTVNGKAASVGSNGAWSATVSLRPGENTLRAVATDGSGNQASATRTVSYGPAAHIRKGKVTWKSGMVRVPLTCVKGGARCSGKIQLTARQTKFKGHGRKRRRHVVTVKVGSASYSLSAGKKKTVRVKLNGLGRRLLKSHKRLKINGTVGLRGANGKSHTAARFSVTAKQGKAKKKKH